MASNEYYRYARSLPGRLAAVSFLPSIVIVIAAAQLCVAQPESYRYSLRVAPLSPSSTLSDDGPVLVSQAEHQSEIDPGKGSDAKNHATKRKHPEEKQAAEIDQLDRNQAALINSVPGVHVTVQDLREEPIQSKTFSLNPVRWFFGPLITLEQQTVRLQQQMIKLTGPLAALQPVIVGLHDQVESTQKQIQAVNIHLDAVHNQLESVATKMTTIDKSIANTNQHMKGIEAPLSSLQTRMESVESSIVGTYKTIGGMRAIIGDVRNDISTIKAPIMQIQQPLHSIAAPVKNLDKQLTSLHSELVDVHDELGAIRKPLANIENPISNLDEELRGLHKEISELRSLLSLVLTAIFVSAFLTAIGTPIAAILIWRNKHKILPPPRPVQKND